MICAQHSLLGAEQGLSALSVVSIVAGAFVILNSFLMSLGERRRQLAILRAIGVTSSQITGLLLREALILGIVGMLIGMAVGLAVSVALVGTMEQLLGVTLRRLELAPQPFILAALFGPGMALFATFAPRAVPRGGHRSPICWDCRCRATRRSPRGWGASAWRSVSFRSPASWRFWGAGFLAPCSDRHSRPALGIDPG